MLFWTGFREAGERVRMNPGVNVFALAVLGAWLPAIFLLFALMPSRRAVIAAFLIGYLFLPDARFTFHTLPDVSKVSLTAIGVLLATLCFDPAKVLQYRPRWIDLPALVLSLSPIATSISNGLGYMDGFANAANRICNWSLAYFIGRMYFTDWAAVRELAVGIVLGGLSYVPLCWWEIRMSPQLHAQLYGLQFMSFRTDSPIFGYRPNVFLANGLTVTMFMGICTVIAFWLWLSGSLKKLWTIPALGFRGFADHDDLLQGAGRDRHHDGRPGRANDGALAEDQAAGVGPDSDRARFTCSSGATATGRATSWCRSLPSIRGTGPTRWNSV